MSALARTLPRRLAVILALLLAAWGLGAGRRAMIRQFFVDGAVPGDAPVWPRIPVGEGLAPAARVRVVLLDGLSRAHARGLAQLSALCARGQELVVDVGFPTVSLPVQHALWTGLTQQQSGLQYHVGLLPRPPAHALPGQIDSTAIAESHPEIVHSFGFTRTEPALPAKGEAPPPAWRDHEFAVAARRAVASSARLAFVHVLRVDEAGHALGGDSLTYAIAAAWGDALLGALHTAAPADPSTLWVVLADHGHRDAGGHGGAEPEIRLVRACVAGSGVPADATQTPRVVHLVDLARALADALELPPTPGARGRPWAAALLEPARGATLPRPGAGRWTVAGGLLLLMILSLWTGRSQHVQSGRSNPWPRWTGLLDATRLTGPRWLVPALGAGWLALAGLGVVLGCGWPTLSNPAVYPPQGRDMLYASGPGLAALAGLAALTIWRWDLRDGALVRAALLPWVLATLALLCLCRGVDALVLGLPPLMPISTGLTSMLLVQGRAACQLLGLLLSLRLGLQLLAVWRLRTRMRRPAPAPDRP
jgi:hypothetical protein